MLKPFPNKDEIIWKPKFEERYKGFLGNRYKEYQKYTLSFLRRSIRINTIKISIEECKKRLEKKDWVLTQVPWCKQGFWVEHKSGRRDIGNTLEYKLGFYYVQEAASMIPPLVLDPKPEEKILDMCAAPGSKTTQIAQYMENKGLVVANDFKGDRLKALGINVQRMGLTNVLITLMFGHWFSKSGLMFDKILVDAPCSGTGTIRKSVKTLRIWNPTMIERLAVTQKKLIKVAYDILKPGGTLVYSTCSNEPLEDEGVVDHLLNETDAKLEDIDLDLNRSPLIIEFEGKKYSKEVEKTLRLWPQDNDTEGFFVAKIKKPQPL